MYADVKLREALQGKLKNAGLSNVEIERSINKIKITLHVSRPGVVIGRGGSGLEELKKYIYTLFSELDSDSKGKLKIEVAVEPVKEPNLNAQLVSANIADQIARRMPHKRVSLQAIDRVMSSGALGVKVVLSGRIAGAEIARREKYQAGSIPLSTIRKEVDYAHTASLTKSGYVGVKVWIYRKS